MFPIIPYLAILINMVSININAGNAYLNGTENFFTSDFTDENEEKNYWIENIAVFLLGGFRNSETLLSKQNANGETDYFARVEAAKATWAKYVKHLYYVTGKGEWEDSILSNTNVCMKLDGESFPLLHHNDKQELYHCAGIHILHFKQCDNTAWGHAGPCCRCSNAMRFYLMMSKHHSSHSRNNNFPEWFIFSDDDYYMRMHMLDAILKNPHTPASNAYSVSWANIPHDPPVYHYGLNLFHETCNAACVHRFPWMGWGGFSLKAIQDMADSILKDDLISICKIWEITHDVGLGVFTWTHGIPAITVKAQHILEQPDSVLWHNPLRFMPTAQYDIIKNFLWLRAFDWYMAAHPGDDSITRDKFNIRVYVAAERAAGLNHTVNIPMRNISGFKNSLLYQREGKKNEDRRNVDKQNLLKDESDMGHARDFDQQRHEPYLPHRSESRHQLRRLSQSRDHIESHLQDQVQEQQEKLRFWQQMNLALPSRDIERHLLSAKEVETISTTMSILAYSRSHCDEDKTHYNAWASQAGWPVEEAFTSLEEETVKCDAYAAYMLQQ